MVSQWACRLMKGIKEKNVQGVCLLLDPNMDMFQGNNLQETQLK
jgi:hypothetical protein